MYKNAFIVNILVICCVIEIMKFCIVITLHQSCLGNTVMVSFPWLFLFQ